MFRFSWMVLVLCFGAIASAQSNPEHDKLKAEARAAYDQSDFVKTKELISKVLAQNPKDHAALYLRASSRVELGALRRDLKELRQGIEDARTSLKIGGGSDVNYYLPYLYGMISLANIEDKREHAKVALDVARTVLARSNLNPEQRANVLYQRASAHTYMQDLDAAIQDYQEAIKIFPAHTGSYMGLVQCYSISGQFDKAMDTFAAAVEQFPDNHIVYNNRGLFLQQHDKPQDAMKDFDKAIELNAKFATAYTNRGFINQGLGNLQAAEADYAKALALDSENPLFYSLRGTCRLSQGNTEGATEDYLQAIRISPKNPVAQADLGFAKFFARDFEGAYNAFDQSTKIDPKAMRYLSPWKVWALVLADKPDAADHIASVSENKAEEARDWIDAQVLFLKGKISEKEFIEFDSKKTNDELKNAKLCEAYYFIAERRFQANELSTAIDFYQRVLKTNETQLSAYRGAQFATQLFDKK